MKFGLINSLISVTSTKTRKKKLRLLFELLQSSGERSHLSNKMEHTIKQSLGGPDSSEPLTPKALVTEVKLDGVDH